ncbi:hypothetical protein CEXT_172261 [Caerostris extrusa]|uniref:Secreted protein n=1 Tax=Caerostris extrusa TaxID=172846 RepID=A0AAV4MMY5_CAEEX|nr:hypothetical protein CEXT_172261 [Caerostris extrusa]
MWRKCAPYTLCSLTILFYSNGGIEREKKRRPNDKKFCLFSSLGFVVGGGLCGGDWDPIKPEKRGSLAFQAD